MFSYDTWMLILAGAAALTLPFVVISTMLDVLSFRNDRSQAYARGLPRPRFPWHLNLFCILLAASIFGLIFTAHELIPAKAPAWWTDTSYDGAPLGMEWSTANFITHRVNPNAAEIHIDIFSVWARNLGPDQPIIKNATLISGVDGKILQMTVADGVSGEINATDAVIPVGTEFAFYAKFDKNDNGYGSSGLSEAEFNQEWGIFRIVIEYDNLTIRHDFNREWVSRTIAAADPRLGPHISKRQ